MNWLEYRSLALRTESVPANRFDKVPYNMLHGEPGDQLTAYRDATRLLHAALGLCTEVAELQDGVGRVNMVEEIGDVYWYLAILDDVIDWFSYPIMAGCKPTQDIGFYVAEIQDIVKRHIFYGTALDIDRARAAAICISTMLDKWLMRNDLKMEMAWEANIRKLEKRYPEKMFTAQAAVHRDVDRELDHILETGELVPRIDTILGLQEDEDAADAKLVEERKDNPKVAVTMDDFGNLNPTPLSREAWQDMLIEGLSKSQIEKMAMDLVTERYEHYQKLGALELARGYYSLYRTYSDTASKLQDATLWVLWNELGYGTDASSIRDKLQRWM